MTVSAAPNTETPSKHRRDPVIDVMSNLRAQGLGHEDLFVILKSRGFAVSRGECRRFVIPQTHDGLRQQGLTGGR